MSLILNPYRFAAGAPATPTLDTLDEWWVCKNNATYYDSTADALIGKRGVGDFQLGATTSAAEASNPTFGNDGTHELLDFAGDDWMTAGTNSAWDPGSGDFTAVVVFTMPASFPGGAHGILERRISGGGAGWKIQLLPSGRIQVVIWRPSPMWSDSAVLSTSTRYTLAARRNGTVESVIVDGTDVDGGVTAAGDLSGTASFYAGRNEGGGNLLTGKIHGIAFTKSAMTSAATVTAGSELLSLAAL